MRRSPPHPAPLALRGDPTPLTLSSTAGIAVGTQLIYRAPVNTQATFPSAVVNVTLEDRVVDGTTIRFPAAGHDQAAENVYVGATVYTALNSGDAVRYTLDLGPSIGLTIGDDLLRHQVW